MRTVFCLLAVLAAVTATNAYTASNPIGPTLAGAGAGTISGFAVSDIHYELAGAEIAAVSFQLDPPTATTARVRLLPAGAWHDCTVVAGAATCPTPGATPDATGLDVVAAG